MAGKRSDLPTFSRRLRGYAPEEVDDFLQEAADTIFRLSDERVRLTEQVARLEEQLAEQEQREAALRDTLVVSRRMSEEMQSQAQREAQIIMEAAQRRAESLTNQAAVRLARILDEISEARKLKAQFEFKVRSVIEGHLKLLELGQVEDAHMEKAAAFIGRPAPGVGRRDG